MSSQMYSIKSEPESVKFISAYREEEAGGIYEGREREGGS